MKKTLLTNPAFRYIFEVFIIIFSVTISFYIQDVLNEKDRIEIKNKALINSKKLFQQKIKKKFVLIHLDEKWNDVLHINEDFFNELINFKNETKYKLVLTSNRNNHLYYKNIKKKLSNHKDILFLENLSLELLERIMSMSSYTVSCHSGFIVQIAGFNKTKVIDVINKKDLIWYSCWKPLNTKHKFVFKSNYNKKIDLNFIDLFSGAGGLSLGFQGAGFNKVASFEIDKDASATIEKNFKKQLVPNSPVRGVVFGISRFNYRLNHIDNTARNYHFSSFKL